MNIKSVDQIMDAWTAEHQCAALKEGWDLFTATDGSPVQVQRDDAAGILPNDDTAMMMVRTGTGAHHSVARKIIHDYFPEEWALLEQAAAQVRT